MIFPSGPFVGSVPTLLLSLLIAGGNVAIAAEYSSAFRIDSSYEIDDNIQLRETNETSIAGYTLSPGLALNYRTPTFSAGLKGTLAFADFDEEQYNSDDQKVALTLTETTQHNVFSLGAGVNRDSSRTSELLDTGRITNTAVRRKDLWLAPSWTHSINPRHAMQFSGRVQQVEYQSDNFADYDYQQLNVTWIMTLSPNNSLHIQVFGNHYENDQRTSVDSNSYGLQMGGVIKISENLSLTGLAGLMKAKTNYEVAGAFDTELTDSGIFETDLANSSLFNNATTVQFENTTVTLDGSLKYQQQRYSLSLNVSSKTQPSGNGYEQQSDHASMVYRYRLTERTNVQINASYGENASQDNSISDQRNYSSVQLAMNYKLTKTLRVGGRYRFRSQERENTSVSAESNAVFITLTYQPQTQKWSR